MFFTFHISIDLDIFEHRLRFSEISKSLEISKVKKISNVFMLFHFTVSINLVISAFLHFRTSESRKCRNAEIQNAEIDKWLEISKVNKYKHIAYVFSLLRFRAICLLLKIASAFRK